MSTNSSPVSELFPCSEEQGRYLQWVGQLENRKTGIPEPTEAELAAVYAKPCRYRRAARAAGA